MPAGFRHNPQHERRKLKPLERRSRHEEARHLVYNPACTFNLPRLRLRPDGFERDERLRRRRYRRRNGGLLSVLPPCEAVLRLPGVAASGPLLRRGLLRRGAAALAGHLRLVKQRGRPSPRAGRGLDCRPLRHILRHRPRAFCRDRHWCGHSCFRHSQLHPDAVPRTALPAHRFGQHQDCAERLRQLRAGNRARVYTRPDIHTRSRVARMEAFPGRSKGQAAVAHTQPRAAAGFLRRLHIPRLLRRADVPQRHLHELERQRVPRELRHVLLRHGQHPRHRRARGVQRGSA